MLIVCGTFPTFAFLLGIGIALDARDSVYYLKLDLESDIEDLRRRLDAHHDHGPGMLHAIRLIHETTGLLIASTHTRQH